MAEKKLVCQCIRCREVKQNFVCTLQSKLDSYKYQASDGDEYLLSFSEQGLLLALLRLRIPSPKHSGEQLFSELNGASIIRELQVFGKQTQISETAPSIQHKSLGSMLVREAEKITKNLSLNKIAVIAGIGVRPYYEKLGYQHEGYYMTKKL